MGPKPGAKAVKEAGPRVAAMHVERSGVRHGHTSAKTCEVYTKGVDRARLAQQAIALLAQMDW